MHAAVDPTAEAHAVPAVFSARTRLLVVAPHPDDETVATGVLIQQVRAAGGEVRVLLLTLGDNNPWPQRWLERRWRIGGAERYRWGQRRLAEIQQALPHLGLSADALHCLGWPDLGVTDILLRQDGAARDAFMTALAAFRPSHVVMPALQDRHPDHSAAHMLARLALARLALAAPVQAAPQLLTYLIHGRPTVAAPLSLQASPACQANKQAALSCHRSQLALSGRRMRAMTARPERFGWLQAAGQQASGAGVALPWRPARWLRPWLRLTMLDDRHAQQWRWPNAPWCQDNARGPLPCLAQPSLQPCFIRVQLPVPTPWIFDHWGWCEV